MLTRSWSKTWDLTLQRRIIYYCLLDVGLRRWRGDQRIALKFWRLPVNPHGVTTQRTFFIAVRTSDLISLPCISLYLFFPTFILKSFYFHVKYNLFRWKIQLLRDDDTFLKSRPSFFQKDKINLKLSLEKVGHTSYRKMIQSNSAITRFDLVTGFLGGKTWITREIINIQAQNFRNILCFYLRVLCSMTSVMDMKIFNLYLVIRSDFSTSPTVRFIRFKT